MQVRDRHRLLIRIHLDRIMLLDRQAAALEDETAAALDAIPAAGGADATGQTIDIVENEIRRMGEEGPTAEEVIKAKTYLKGSFALGLDTSSRIASQLVQMQLDNLGIDYIERRAAMIDAVTLADAKRVAKRLLDGGLLVTVVGRPEGVTSTESATGTSPNQLAKPRETPADREPAQR